MNVQIDEGRGGEGSSRYKMVVNDTMGLVGWRTKANENCTASERMRSIYKTTMMCILGG